MPWVTLTLTIKELETLKAGGNAVRVFTPPDHPDKWIRTGSAHDGFDLLGLLAKRKAGQPEPTRAPRDADAKAPFSNATTPVYSATTPFSNGSNRLNPGAGEGSTRWVNPSPGWDLPRLVSPPGPCYPEGYPSLWVNPPPAWDLPLVLSC